MTKTKGKWQRRSKKLMAHPVKRLTITIDVTPSGWLRISAHDEWNRVHSVRSCDWAAYPALPGDVHRIERAVLAIIDEGVAAEIPF